MSVERYIDRARILTEALPYIRRFSGSSVVVKPSCALMRDPSRQRSIATDLTLLKYVGIHPIVVYGESGGEGANSRLVSSINGAGGKAVGLSGRDGNLFTVRKDGRGEAEIESVDTSLLRTLAGEGYIPVLSAVGVSRQGEDLEVDPDNVAGEVAEAIRATKLIYLAECRGVERGGELLDFLDLAEAEALLGDGGISGSMRSRLADAVMAIKGGVTNVHILDGRCEHAVLLEIFTDAGVGTMISNERVRL